MPSRTIRPTQVPVAAPFPYTVTAPAGFTPEAVFAAWDGSGAGGDFLPCVSYYNADGVLLDRAFPSGVTLHPGDTADASYRPFDRSSGASSAASLLTTDGVLTVNPTTELSIDGRLTLTEPGAGIAQISANPVTRKVPHFLYATTANDLASGAFWTPAAAWDWLTTDQTGSVTSGNGAWTGTFFEVVSVGGGLTQLRVKANAPPAVFLVTFGGAIEGFDLPPAVAECHFECGTKTGTPAPGDFILGERSAIGSLVVDNVFYSPKVPINFAQDVFVLHSGYALNVGGAVHALTPTARQDSGRTADCKVHVGIVVLTDWTTL